MTFERIKQIAGMLGFFGNIWLIYADAKVGEQITNHDIALHSIIFIFAIVLMYSNRQDIQKLLKMLVKRV